MRWSPQQDEALKAISRWLKTGGEQVFRLFGYAGVGKTELIRHIAHHVEGEVIFLAFTGKAASVMRARGCPGARTIHSTIYLPPPLLSKRAKEIKARLLDLDPGSDEYIALEKELQRHLTNRHWILRPELESPPKLIICDEVSMVNEMLATDLLSFGIRMLVVGDPEQLPPVRGDGYFLSADPNVMTEIHRQAWDSPVLRMATQVRMNGASSLPFDGMFHLPIRAVGRDDLRAMATVADQVLVGRHVTRRMYNEAMRRAGGFSGPMPNVGEKLVCCRNNNGMGLLNGTLWRVLECVEDVKGDDLVYRARLESLNNDNVEPIDNVIMDAKAFVEDDPNRVHEESDINIFVPGYAITVHKAQGSQWPDILIIDDWRCGDRDKWLYTALTRACKHATIVAK